jgi:hypothetical protein
MAMPVTAPPPTRARAKKKHPIDSFINLLSLHTFTINQKACSVKKENMTTKMTMQVTPGYAWSTERTRDNAWGFDLTLSEESGSTFDPKMSPLDVSLVLDTSSSMVGQERQLRSMVRDIVTYMNRMASNRPDIRLGVVSFSHEASLIRSLDTLPANAEKMLESIRIDGMTDIWAGLKLALKDMLSKPCVGEFRGHRVIIVLSDGLSTSGNCMHVKELLHKLRKESHLLQEMPTIFTVSIGDDCDFELLHGLTNLTPHGFCFEMKGGSDFSAALGAILGQRLYTLAYNVQANFTTSVRRLSKRGDIPSSNKRQHEHQHQHQHQQIIELGNIALTGTRSFPFSFSTTPGYATSVNVQVTYREQVSGTEGCVERRLPKLELEFPELMSFETWRSVPRPMEPSVFDLMLKRDFAKDLDIFMVRRDAFTTSENIDALRGMLNSVDCSGAKELLAPETSVGISLVKRRIEMLMETATDREVQYRIARCITTELPKGLPTTYDQVATRAQSFTDSELLGLAPLVRQVSRAMASDGCSPWTEGHLYLPPARVRVPLSPVDSMYSPKTQSSCSYSSENSFLSEVTKNGYPDSLFGDYHNDLPPLPHLCRNFTTP